MIPRRDPETVPAAMSVQVLRRKPTDKYGHERGGRHGALERPRRLQTRNGLPIRLYEYRGTGYCMTENEAEWWLETRWTAT